MNSRQITSRTLEFAHRASFALSLLEPRDRDAVEHLFAKLAQEGIPADASLLYGRRYVLRVGPVLRVIVEESQEGNLTIVDIFSHAGAATSLAA